MPLTMSRRIKLGLLAGVVGLIVNALGSTLICPPMGMAVSVFVGLAVGYFVAAQERAASQTEGITAGAITGAIAGALILVGQMLSAMLNEVLFIKMGATLPFSQFGQLPDLSTPGGQTYFWMLGVFTGLMCGLIDVVLAAGGGALGGYFGVVQLSIPPSYPPAQPPEPPTGV